MESIKDKVAIIGMGCTKFGELWDKGPEDLIIEAAYEAYEDAGIEPKDIQAAWVGTTRQGRTGGCLSAPLKLKYIPISRVEDACATASQALRNATYAVACGAYDIVLALGYDKLKDAPGRREGGGGGGDHFGSPFFGLPYIPPVNFGVTATRYAHTFGLSYDELKATLGKIAVKNHHHGSMHPKAHLRFEITLEQAINAPMVSWPLGLYDCCGVTDGAAAAIITRRELAKSFREDPVYIKGMGVAAGPGMPAYMPGYDFIHWEHTLQASKQAYEQAGIKNPRKELDLAIVHDCFTITELLIYEDLGFCEKGHA